MLAMMAAAASALHHPAAPHPAAPRLPRAHHARMRWTAPSPAAPLPLPTATPAFWSLHEHAQQQALRWAPLGLGAAYAAWPAARHGLDAAVASVWAGLCAQPWAHHCMFEACTASFGFFAAIVFFSSLHRLMRSPAAAYRLDGQPPSEMFQWLTRRHWRKWLPLPVYLLSVRAFHLLRTKPLLPMAPPSFGLFAAELACGIFLYDLLFYPLHRLLHATRWGKRVHAYHHSWPSGRSLAPLETVQHSYADGFLQVAVNIFVQCTPLFGPKHVLSRLAHNLVVTYLLAEAHSGYDLPWSSHRAWPALFGGAPRHEHHHASGRGAYQQFFRYLDDADLAVTVRKRKRSPLDT